MTGKPTEITDRVRTRLKYAHFPYLRDALQSCTNAAAAGSPPEVLDVGCGPGNLAAFCGSDVLCRWHGLDLWEHELAQAQATGAYEQLYRVNLVEGLPLRDRSFDAVICNEVLMYLPNPADTVTEFHRCLRPGGWLFVHNPISWFPVAFAGLRNLIRNIHQEPKSVALDRQTELAGARRVCRITYYSYESLIHEVGAGGFTVVDVAGFRLFRNRIRWMTGMEDFPAYHSATRFITGKWPWMASDVMVVGRKL